MTKGLRYNTAVTLFFVPYTLLEVPSNIVLKMLRPSRWMAVLMFLLGIGYDVCSQAILRNWSLIGDRLMCLISSYEGLLAARFFLGVAEVSSACLYMTTASTC